MAFAPELFCVSESGGPISCYHIDGSEIWELQHEDGVHALDLSYDQNRKSFLAITWPYEEGGDTLLLSIGSTTGEIIDSLKLPDETSFYFAENGRVLVSNDGEILDSDNGKPIGSLKL